MGFFLSLIIIVAIQRVLSIVLAYFGLPYVFINMVVDLVLAFVFTYWNFSRLRVNRKELLKDISFHTNVCIWYAVLTGLDLVFMMF